MTNNTELKIKLPLLFACTLALGMFLGTRLSKQMQKRTDNNGKIVELLDLLQKNYVDDINVDSLRTSLQKELGKSTDSLQQNAMEQLLAHLDPHSVYIPPTELKLANEEIKGAFAGIGIEYGIIDDTLHVVYIVPEGPSASANVKVGDKILKVGDSVITNIKLTGEKIRNYLRGPDNSSIHLLLLRDGKKIPITVKRGSIPIPSIDAAYMINATTGFIKLNKFSLTSSEEFKTALQNLVKSGMQELIFDLRGNGGGILGDAVAIVDEFLDGNKLVVYTEGVHQKRQEYHCSQKGLFETGKLYILVDEETASASEIVAGALQDWDRATILGRRTFGKGLVQRQFGFSDHSGVRITIARYYTPLGRSIQKSYTKGIESYQHDLEHRLQNGGLVNADSNKLEKGKVYTTKAGNKVYGGGGISPNIFVPLDTSIKYTPTLYKLMGKNTLSNFVFKLYINNKPQYEKYANSTQFAENYIFNATDWQSFTKFCEKDSVMLNGLNAEQTDLLKNRMKQLLARQIWRMNGYYRIVQENDATLKKAIELIDK
jgi:carboxyl-terminal processing protease